MSTITFTTDTRRAVVSLEADGGMRIDLYAVVHPSRPKLGEKLLRTRRTGSRYTAVGIAQDWVGRGARVEESAS